MPEGGPLRYDTRELRRMIAMSFSAGELSKYAEGWRVFIDREGSSEDGARALVRALETRDKLDGLVESLRAQKPLVEWPEPTIPPKLSATPIGESAPVAGSHVAATVPGAPAPSPGGPGPAQDDTFVDEDAVDSEEEYDDEEPEPLTRLRPPALSAQAPPQAPIIDPYLDAAPPPRPPVARWLAFAGIGVGGIGIGILVTYLIVRDDSAAPTDPPATVAQMAAEHLRERVVAIAEACDTSPQGDSAREVLAAAFEECGIPNVRPGKILPSPLAPPVRDRPAPARPNAVPRRTEPAAPRCLDACHETYESCASAQCGQEPSSANDYAAYQRCLHTCQSQYGRCKLMCR